MYNEVNKKDTKRILKFANRIKKVRQLTRTSQGDLAARLGINRNTYISYESGNRKLPLDVAETLCNALGVRPEYMLTGNEPVFGDNPGPDGFVFVKQYEVQVKNKKEGAPGGEKMNGQFAFRRGWLQSLGLGGESAGVVQIKGDSMEPVLKEGDWVLLDMSARRVTRSGIYCLQLAEDLACKTCARDQDGSTVHVMSYNQIYKDLQAFNFKFKDTNHNAPLVIGRAVYFGRKI